MSDKIERCFLTGCDKNTEWMLKWFLKNYIKHNKTPIVFADFGVTPEMRAWVYQVSEFVDIIDVQKQLQNGWFLKPKSLLAVNAVEVCWLDTDIHVLGDLSGIFNYVEDGKLGMVEDKPWSARRGEKWHNSGVIAIRNKPPILKQWVEKCMTGRQGDQEVLHDMFGKDQIMRMTNVTDLPNIYNWLRIQILDGFDSKNKLAMHWTGQKGNETIRNIMYNEQ
jgi:hypothetical protein